jgi:hypothetical protein
MNSGVNMEGETGAGDLLVGGPRWLSAFDRAQIGDIALSAPERFRDRTRDGARLRRRAKRALNRRILAAPAALGAHHEAASQIENGNDVHMAFPT